MAARADFTLFSQGLASRITKANRIELGKSAVAARMSEAGANDLGRFILLTGFAELSALSPLAF